MAVPSPSEYIDTIRALSRAQILVPDGRALVGQPSLQRWACAAQERAELLMARRPGGFAGLDDAFVDGFRLAAIRFAAASASATRLELADDVRRVGREPLGSAVLDLGDGQRHALLDSLLAEFHALHTAIGPNEWVLRDSPLLHVAADEVLGVRRDFPQADGAMIARALIDRRLRFRENVAVMVDNFRVMENRNWVLQARLSKQELRGFATYRVLPQRYSWANPTRECSRLEKRYAGLLDADTVRYVLVYRSGDAADHELGRLCNVASELRRSYIGFAIPSRVLNGSVRHSLDRMEAEERIRTFIVLRRNLQRATPTLDPETANRSAAARLERVMAESTYRAVVLAGLGADAAAVGGLERD